MGTFHDKPELRPLRKGLRNESTAAEATLWTCLKSRRLSGRKIRRQHSFGSHVIVDFYCPEERLAIQLDGKEHSAPLSAMNDEVREELLRKNAVRVVRFGNKKEVFEDMQRVLEGIKSAFRPASL